MSLNAYSLARSMADKVPLYSALAVESFIPMNLFTQFCVVVCLIYLCACASEPPEIKRAEAAPAGNYYVGTRPVYAHLEQGSGGSWILKTVTASDNPPDDGYLVRLNDLAPSFDIRIAECEPQTYPNYHKCNPGQPFRDKQIGVMGKIISGGIAAGTAGKVTDLSRTYRTSFDEAAFNQAVDEALINTGLHNKRREFLAALERYDTLFSSGQSELATLRNNTLSSYENTEDLSFSVRPKITGLTRYYSADIDFRDLVRVEAQTSKGSMSATLERKDILPCDARRCVAAANAALSALTAEVALVKRNLNSTLAQSTSEYKLYCDKTSHGGYSFNLDCLDTVSPTNVKDIPVTLHILSRDFNGLYPKFSIDDDNLSVDIEGDQIKFRNHTNSYLSVNAQTIYYNSQVQTRSEPIEIAPGVTIRRSINDFVTPAIQIEASYRQMTPDKAERTSFRFGFAARYRLAESGEETTLYDLRSFNAGCVIDNRLRPGSCQFEKQSLGSESTEAEEEE